MAAMSIDTRVDRGYLEPERRRARADAVDRLPRRAAAVILALILLTGAVIVFWPGPPDPHGQSSLRDYLESAHQHGLPRWISFGFVENASNVVMFVPIGLLGSLALRRRNYLVVLLAAMGSGLIELVQLLLLPDRVASLDDVLANTAGAVVGLLCSVPALRRRYRRRRQYLRGRTGAADSPRRVARTARLNPA